MSNPDTIAPVRFADTPPAMRRNVRETALRVLYAMDAGKRSLDDVLEDSVQASELDERGRANLKQLVKGALDNRASIDRTLDKFATDFPTHRQAVVDRNILRLAAAEIVFHVSDAPAGAVVNEAVELAKKYSTKDSGRFVNGVLGALVRGQEGTVIEPPQVDETEIVDAPTHMWGEVLPDPNPLSENEPDA